MPSKKKKIAKENNNSSSTKQKILKFLENAIIVSAIIGIFGFFFASYFGFREKILNTYENLANDIEGYIFIDENLYVFCQDYSPPNSNNAVSCSCLKDIELYKIRQQMSEQFAKIFSNMRILGKLMSYDTYAEIHRLTYWNNELLVSQKGVCGSGLLVHPKYMDQWRNQIEEHLMKEREYYKGIFYSMNKYFKYLFTDIENERYASFEVDLNKLPIYQNKNN